MNHRSLFVLMLLFAAAVATISQSTPVNAAPVNKTPGGGGDTVSTVGYDVSYPQCGSVLPSDRAFGIIGVNGGKATNLNPCLADQLMWAAGSSGSVPSQPKVQVYVNTANPGEVIDQITTWPTAGETPYGTCDGTNSEACSWQYGWERAVVDVNTYFKPAAGSAGLPTEASGYIWWLDVETTNSWQSGSPEALARNRATLEGMTAYFSGQRAQVGIYSTNYQWDTIAGTVPTNSNLYTLNSWMAGARTLRGAKENCQNKPLVAGGKVVLSQYVTKGLDHNYSCI